MANPNRLTEADWRTIRLLKQHGVTDLRIAEITNRSRSIVYYASRANSFEDFREAKRKSYESKDSPKLPPKLQPLIPRVIPVRSEVQYEFKPVAEPSETDNVLRVLENLNQGLLSFAETLERLEGKLDDVLDTKRPWLKNLRK